MILKKVALAMSSIIIQVTITIIVIIVIYNASMAAYDFGFNIFGAKPMAEAPGTDIEVTIDSTEKIDKVGKILENNGLIQDKKMFYVQEKLSAYEGKLQPGTYTLNTSMTAEQMMAVMAEGYEENEDTKE